MCAPEPPAKRLKQSGMNNKTISHSVTIVSTKMQDLLTLSSAMTNKAKGALTDPNVDDTRVQCVYFALSDDNSLARKRLNCKKFNISEADITRLQSRRFLNDTLINVINEILFDKLQEEVQKRCLIVSVGMYKLLLHCYYPPAVRSNSINSRVQFEVREGDKADPHAQLPKCWNKCNRMADKNVLIFPICYQEHFMLGIIYYNTINNDTIDWNTSGILFFNSLPTNNINDTYQISKHLNVLKWCMGAVVQNNRIKWSNDDTDNLTKRTIIGTCPRQQNNYNCGDHILKMTSIILANVHQLHLLHCITFNDAEIDLMRVTMQSMFDKLSTINRKVINTGKLEISDDENNGGDVSGGGEQQSKSIKTTTAADVTFIGAGGGEQHFKSIKTTTATAAAIAAADDVTVIGAGGEQHSKSIVTSAGGIGAGGIGAGGEQYDSFGGISIAYNDDLNYQMNDFSLTSTLGCGNFDSTVTSAPGGHNCNTSDISFGFDPATSTLQSSLMELNVEFDLKTFESQCTHDVMHDESDCCSDRGSYEARVLAIRKSSPTPPPDSPVEWPPIGLCGKLERGIDEFLGNDELRHKFKQSIPDDVLNEAKSMVMDEALKYYNYQRDKSSKERFQRILLNGSKLFSSRKDGYFVHIFPQTKLNENYQQFAFLINVFGLVSVSPFYIFKKNDKYYLTKDGLYYIGPNEPFMWPPLSFAFSDFNTDYCLDYLNKVVLNYNLIDSKQMQEWTNEILNIKRNMHKLKIFEDFVINYCHDWNILILQAFRDSVYSTVFGQLSSFANSAKIILEYTVKHFIAKFSADTILSVASNGFCIIPRGINRVQCRKLLSIAKTIILSIIEMDKWQGDYRDFVVNVDLSGGFNIPAMVVAGMQIFDTFNLSRVAAEVHLSKMGIINPLLSTCCKYKHSYQFPNAKENDIIVLVVLKDIPCNSFSVDLIKQRGGSISFTDLIIGDVIIMQATNGVNLGNISSVGLQWIMFWHFSDLSNQFEKYDKEIRSIYGTGELFFGNKCQNALESMKECQIECNNSLGNDLLLDKGNFVLTNCNDKVGVKQFKKILSSNNKLNNLHFGIVWSGCGIAPVAARHTQWYLDRLCLFIQRNRKLLFGSMLNVNKYDIKCMKCSAQDIINGINKVIFWAVVFGTCNCNVKVIQYPSTVYHLTSSDLSGDTIWMCVWYNMFPQPFLLAKLSQIDATCYKFVAKKKK